MEQAMNTQNNQYATGRMILAVVLSFVSIMDTTSAEPKTAKTQLATIGGGCFWCVEAVFERFEGVKNVVSGYAAGKTENPTYKQICEGTSGHAEVIQIEFDPAKITFEQLLEVFWEAHDPTTMNRQGADEGTQYRSIVICHDKAQQVAAEKSKAAAGKKFQKPIVTEVVSAVKFWPAEEYHQDYFRRNPNAPYCAIVISPKLLKLEKKIKP